jgi:hypothetical protein
VRFFEARRETAKNETKEWVRWYHGFSLLLNRQIEKAASGFSILAQFSKDAVITALSAYFISSSISRALPEQEAELKKIANRGSERVLKALPREKDWEREVSRLSAEIHVAVLSKYTKETSRWLYTPQYRSETNENL